MKLELEGEGSWHEPKNDQRCKKGRNQRKRGSSFEISA